MKIRNKFMLPVIGTIAILAIIGTIALVYSVNNLVATQEEHATTFADDMFLDHLQGEAVGIMGNIDRIAERGREQAAIFASLPSVRAAYQLAMTGDVNNETDPLVQQAREDLRIKIAPLIKNLKQQTGTSKVNLHFHLSNNRSFVRTWRDGWQAMRNGKKVDISDDLSSFRKTVVTINQGQHQPLTGVEIGRGGFVIRGLVPVTSAGGEHLGSCEVYFPFSALFKMSIPEGEEHLNLAAYMDKSMLPVAKSLQDPSKYPVVDDKYVLTAASDPQLMKELASGKLLDSGRSELQQQFIGSQLVSTFPILDFSGNTVGVFVLTHQTGEIDAMKSGMIASAKSALSGIKTSMIVGVLVILVVICGVIYTISGAITKPIQTTVGLLGAISERDLSKDVPQELRNRKDEMGEMTQTL
ncbi:MAG: cache domain-containing protein, partial [Thermodesulfobacteriota bacterium]|nr:cache domain-containing protein [Thermodesulfobacteriota bacterium]